MKRSILNLDIDTFFVACERLNDSQLNKRPLIVGGSSDRGIVVSCSYEALRYNVRVGMPISLALKLCSNAKVIKGDFDLYSKKSQEITEIIKEKAPLMEKSSIQEFYVDMTGMDYHIGSVKWTNELIDRIKKESGLTMSYGLSINKTVSRIATQEGRPFSTKVIALPHVRPFLAPLSIRRIPKIRVQTSNSLHRIGIRKIKTLSETPVRTLTSLVGKKEADDLWHKANGIDHSPVVQHDEKKSISVDKTFEIDTLDIIGLKACISSMGQKLCFQLRQANKLTSIVSLRIRYTNSDSESLRKRISYTSLDNVIIPILQQLFVKLYQRRMRLRSISITYAGLVAGNYQIDLFNDTTEYVALYQAMDRMKARYGEKYIQMGNSLTTIKNDI